MSEAAPLRPPTMLIVSGWLRVDPAERDDYAAAMVAVVTAARQAPGCRDFVVAADPVEPDRLNVYEAWDDEPSLLAFRGAGPSAELSAQILDADVQRHEIARSGPA